MLNRKIKSVIFCCLLCFSSFKAFAWEHSIQLGYGMSHHPSTNKINNSGFLLSGDLYPLQRTDMTYWTLNGALGQWQTTADQNKNLTTAALSLALRFYVLDFDENLPAYLLGSVGPAYLSSKKFGDNEQAENFTLQFNGGLGAEFNSFDVNLRFVTFSSVGLTSPNQPFSILYLLSIGYLF